MISGLLWGCCAVIEQEQPSLQLLMLFSWTLIHSLASSEGRIYHILARNEHQRKKQNINWHLPISLAIMDPTVTLSNPCCLAFSTNLLSNTMPVEVAKYTVPLASSTTTTAKSNHLLPMGTIPFSIPITQ